MTRQPQPLPRVMLEPLVRAALLEDLGRGGDLTTEAVVSAQQATEAFLVARAAGTLAGLDAAALAFQIMDPAVTAEPLKADGEALAPGDSVLRLTGPARAILSAERVALNLVCHLSGIATATAELVAAVRPHPVHVTCTRKTTPGLRALEKYAVRAGGGANHRLGLDDAILIKDNHIALAGGVVEAVTRARARAGHLVKVEVEVDRLDQLEEALGAGPDAVLLDNMRPEQLREAVRIVAGRAVTEASGGITRETIAQVAASGVDVISAGWLTHSAPSLDIGLDVLTG
ncbi:carboxylating nicotinate-nucleotide diphosphorylase [Pelagibius sp.]|uniref:carboxylating nicotinate-nucleotide diphosphorylase n=1 Tax=Pelagibius sp. TaxID=1931238 RepID=UPI00261FF8AE|nr:carboxylating nicotinate-nucleotide diphosphorylase [Pelagibius sp.]